VLRKDFAQEVDNLQILKESLTHHDRIMLHLATIEHGPKHYILLPYANYGDLEQFLHCGIGPDRKPKYDFDQRFKEVGNSDCTHQLLRQCWSLANALVWLHTGITIEKTLRNVFCVHMDLKPANILIKSDPDSVVGKWMISDFGISVLTEETKRQDSEYVSIGDYYSQLTVNTRPKRREGTYQAPEVKLSENVYEQLSNLTPDQKGIGRRSDIWSYGCIFSEVLAFALGRDKLVIEFQAARKRKGMDYFFVEKADHGHLLVPDNIPKQFEVYSPILTWLDGLCDKATTHQRWVDCYVETIKKILIVDTAIRPDATDLLKLVNHVKEHVATPRRSTPVDCPLLQANEEAAVATSAVSISQRGSSSLTSTTSSSGSDLNMESNPKRGSTGSRSAGK
jgi:serine/threonine protein kinase